MSKEADKAVSSYKRLIDFGKIYEVDTEEDYKAAALTYSQEVQLIAQIGGLVVQELHLLSAGQGIFQVDVAAGEHVQED